MTPTERIAVELLGWRVAGDARSGRATCYRKEVGEVSHSAWIMEGVFDGGAKQEWPDLTTLDGCRAFEDALAKRGRLVEEYVKWIDSLAINDPIPHCLGLSWREAQILFATPAQRVAACIAVLDEIAK